MFFAEIKKNYFLIDTKSWKIKKMIKNLSTNFICRNKNNPGYLPPIRSFFFGIDNLFSFFFKTKGALTQLKILNFLNSDSIEIFLITKNALSGNFENKQIKKLNNDHSLQYFIWKTIKTKELFIMKNFSPFYLNSSQLNSGAIYNKKHSIRKNLFADSYKKTIILSTW